MEVVLPSTMSGVIRELGVQEENLLADPKLARSGKNLHAIFKNCWVETRNAGPYKFGESGFDPELLLQGDGMALFTLLRIETYGPAYAFDVNCAYCGTRIPWEIDLAEFLKENTKTLPAASIEILKKDGIFSTVLPKCKRKTNYRLLTMKDELRFPTVRRESADKLSSTILDFSVLDFDGVKSKRAFLGLEPYPKGEPKEYLSSADATWLRQEMDENNCGLVTRIHVECGRCGEVPVDLPFREDFLAPKRSRK
jgi:hypothetical protein